MCLWILTANKVDFNSIFPDKHSTLFFNIMSVMGFWIYDRTCCHIFKLLVCLHGILQGNDLLRKYESVFYHHTFASSKEQLTTYKDHQQSRYYLMILKFLMEKLNWNMCHFLLGGVWFLHQLCFFSHLCFTYIHTYKKKKINPQFHYLYR